MRSFVFKRSVLFFLAFSIATAVHAANETEKQVFSDLLVMGMPVEQAVSGVVTNAPVSAADIVEQALTGYPANVQGITSAALTAAPGESSNIINMAVKLSYLQTRDIINAVAQKAPSHTAETVELLLAKNADKADEIIIQAAEALSLAQLLKNKSLGDNKMLKAMRGL